MAAIDAITAEDVCTDDVTGWRISMPHRLECSMLVCGGVGAEDMIFIDVVGVCSAPARVGWREAKDIKIGRGTDDGVGSIVSLM